MKRFVSVLTVLVLIAAVVLTGCGKPSGESTPPAQGGAEQKVTLRLSGWTSGSGAEADILNSLLADFKAQNPNIDVKYEPVPDRFKEKIQADFAANSEPDVFYVDSFWGVDWMSKNLLLPLDDYIAKANVNVADFEPSLLRAFQFGGKTYGLPKGYSPLGLFYNKDLFAKANIAEPPKTWEELRADAKKLTSGSVKGLVLSYDHARFMPFVWMAGGTPISADKTNITINSPEAVTALDYYTGLITKDKVAATPKDLGAEWAGDAFAKGTAAMALEGHWMLPFLNEKKVAFSWGVAELPAGPKARSNFVFTVSYSISARSKHPEEAFKLVNFLTSPESQKKVAELGLELPSRKSVATPEFLAAKPERQVLLAGAAYAQPFVYTPNSQPWADELNKAMENVVLNGANPKAELDRVQQKFQDTKQ
ncbi:MAG: ABC transporter substrate-binding protein [Bacillota bacterium]